MGEGAIAGGGVAVVLMALMVWLVKKLVSDVLENMKANTDAIRANTIATHTVANTLSNQGVIRDERDRALFKQMDRIESAVAKRPASGRD